MDATRRGGRQFGSRALQLGVNDGESRGAPVVWVWVWVVNGRRWSWLTTQAAGCSVPPELRGLRALGGGCPATLACSPRRVVRLSQELPGRWRDTDGSRGKCGNGCSSAVRWVGVIGRRGVFGFTRLERIAFENNLSHPRLLRAIRNPHTTTELFECAHMRHA